MTIREAFIRVLRAELGPGWEASLPAAMFKEYVIRSLTPKVKAMLKGALDTGAIVAGRIAAEAAAKDAEAQLKALQAQVDADVDAGIGAV